SHREESSRQQVDKDRRTAEQRDELAPSFVEHGASPPLRALGAGNDHQPANGPQPCRQEITSKAAVRTGLPAHAAPLSRLLTHAAPLVGWSGHDASHWRDFRYPWPAAAAGARGPCRLRSHHPCRGCWQPLTYLRGSARWHRSTPCAETSITAPGARASL